MTDYAGIALIVAAVPAGLGTLITSGLAIATFFKQGARDAKIDALAAKTELTHELVNGMSKAKEAADHAVGRAESVVAGVEQERAAPMVPAQGPKK